MVTIRSTNDIILSLIDFFKLAQPDLDTKPGEVARDLFVEAPASQLALLYDELSGVSNKSSLRLVIGSDLDKLAKNFGIIRKQATPATGVALFTFSSINSPININKGDTVIANNGFSYSVVTGVSVVPLASNFYKSVASKFSDQLATVGISDQFAVEVTVLATSAGTSGNIGKFSLSKTTITGVSNVTNINAFTGGTDQESDSAFRTRILSAFNGSSVGTALGYLSTALSVTGVSDAAVIGPGDPLMTRDGTVIKTNPDGTQTVVSEGTGGKVDVVVLGSNLIDNSESYIFIDKSNNNNPTDARNNVVLGQIAADANKTINRKRIDDIKNGQLPAQPVNLITSVTGSLSGSNFIEKSVDQFGRVTGNFELIKDEGVYGGSPWGFDTFHWVSNKISLFNEDRIKGQTNGQDALTFTDVLEIPSVQQSIAITNENSITTFDRSIIQLLHTPATNVTRVFNVNTGERYIITNQNFDNTGTFNTTGRIQISGNTLPSPNEILQVDYNWIVNYDQYSDYDGLKNTNNPRTVNDSVDWGLSSAVRKEKILFTKDSGNNFFIGTASLPVNTVLSADTFLEIDGYVQEVLSGTFIGRLEVVLSNLAITTSSVDSITFVNNNSQLYVTAQNDGTFTNTATVVGIKILFDTTIILPTDTIASVGDLVTVILNSKDVFHSTAVNGNSNGNQISIPTSLIVTTANSLTLETTYLANVSDLFSSAISSLPSSRIGNGFILSNNIGFNNFSPTNISRRENQTIQKNFSSQLLVELNLPSSDYGLNVSQIISVIRLVDGRQLWNADNPGTITVGTSGNYQLIFSGFHAPVTGDRVLVIYYATDLRRFQPFSYNNNVIHYKIMPFDVDPGTNKLTVPINSFTSQSSNLNFKIIEPNTDISLFTVSDGYLIAGSGQATISSLSINFGTLPDLVNKKVQITEPSDDNNSGFFDIISYDAATNNIIIKNILDKVTADQISVIRVLDGKEVWNYAGTIDTTHNKLLMPIGSEANIGDQSMVIFYNFNNLRRAPSRLISTTTDQVLNTGTISVSGTTISKAEDIVFTATNTGLKLNISEAIRKALNLSSAVSIPNNIKIVRILKLEKVITVGSGSDDVLTVLTTYDLKNTTVQDNLFYIDELLSNPSLQNLDFILPGTQNNTANIDVKNLPTLGDKLRITFYYITGNDSENLAYTRNGILYTNKKFAFINKIFVSSGFRTSQSTRLGLTSFTQPSLGSRYKAFYDYLAPKQNERIVINYNFNKLISDVTFSVENNRPINADVLAKEAKLLLLDLTMNVVISPDFLSSTTNVLQNLRDKLINALTTNQLGSVIDVPTLINIAQAVKGIARARVLFFNTTGSVGQVLSIQAARNEFFAPNNVVINTEVR